MLHNNSSDGVGCLMFINHLKTKTLKLIPAKQPLNSLFSKTAKFCTVQGHSNKFHLSDQGVCR